MLQQQRLIQIEQRKSELLSELAALEAEEKQLRNAIQTALTRDPRVINLVKGSITQHGCAEAQALFDAATAQGKCEIFEATLPDLKLLLTSTYGALFVQKILELADTDQLHRVLQHLGAGHAILEIASTTSGSRAIQRFMELLPTVPLATEFSAHLCPDIAALSNDPNACHVVQRALTTRFLAEKEQLVLALVHNLWTIATNKQGCCVLQRAIDWAPEPSRQILVDAVLAVELDLVLDAYGNYVVQHLLERNDESICKRAIQQLLHNVAALACNKFGSNVVEKCVRLANSSIRQLLIDELTDPSVLPRLLQDSYANYVIQTAITSASDDQFQQLHAAIRPNFASLKNSPYGVRVEAKIQRRLKDNARARQRKAKKDAARSSSADHAAGMSIPGTGAYAGPQMGYFAPYTQ